MISVKIKKETSKFLKKSLNNDNFKILITKIKKVVYKIINDHRNIIINNANLLDAVTIITLLVLN